LFLNILISSDKPLRIFLSGLIKNIIMKTFKIISFLLITTTFSCSYIKEKLIGLKQPKIENFQTLKEFTEPHGFDA